MADNNRTTPFKTYKRPVWTRAADILFRAAHVAVAGILLGGAVFRVPHDMLLKWQFVATATGCLLIASEVYHRPHWLRQGRAVMVYIHAGVFFLARFYPGLMIPLLAGAFLFGMVGSHMSKGLRYGFFIHRRAQD